MLRDLITKNRSYRRFDASVPVERETLLELVDLARCSPSAANLQPLKFVLSYTSEVNDKIFPALSWGGYLVNWSGPRADERPAAYIIILRDTSIADNYGCDHGIASQSILLGAVEKGFGGCIMASINHDIIRAELKIPEQYEILLVVALGKPVETVVIDEMPSAGDIKYYRDADDVHHVPKRKLNDIVVNFT